MKATAENIAWLTDLFEQWLTTFESNEECMCELGQRLMEDAARKGGFDN